MIKNFVSTLNTPLFMGMCIYLEVKLIFRSVEHIDQPKQIHLAVSCSCEQKLIGPGMTQAIHIRLDLNNVSLDHGYLTTVSNVGAV